MITNSSKPDPSTIFFTMETGIQWWTCDTSNVNINLAFSIEMVYKSEVNFVLMYIVTDFTQINNITFIIMSTMSLIRLRYTKKNLIYPQKTTIYFQFPP